MAKKEVSQSSSYRSQKATVADLSIFEKLGTIPVILSVAANAFAAIFTSAFRSKSLKPSSTYKYVILTALRTLTRKASVRQQHYLAEPTDDAYLKACKTWNFTPNSEVLEDGTRAHWIGDSKAEKLILNFHGGGYVFPASPDMFSFMFQIVALLKKQNKSVAVLMLSYDLAPGRVYPRQLQQAATLLNHVLSPTHLNISPKNIILTGDSAGANLALQVLSHISHPHPSTTTPIPRIDLKGEKLCGAVLISPWVSFSLSDDSFTRNKYKDCIETVAGTQWSEAFMNDKWPHTKNSDYYNQATTAPPEWWNGLQVESVLVLAGEDEVLVDGIRVFEGKLREGLGEGKMEFCVVPGEFHDQAILDLQLGYTEKDEGKTAKKIKGWISSKL